MRYTADVEGHEVEVEVEVEVVRFTPARAARGFDPPEGPEVVFQILAMEVDGQPLEAHGLGVRDDLDEVVSAAIYDQVLFDEEERRNDEVAALLMANRNG